MPQYCGQESAGAHISPINSNIFLSIFALHKKKTISEALSGKTRNLARKELEMKFL